jgi:hypothetical protein
MPSGVAIKTSLSVTAVRSSLIDFPILTILSKLEVSSRFNRALIAVFTVNQAEGAIR